MESLFDALRRQLFIAEMVNRFPGQPHRWVTKDCSSAQIPAIRARVRDYRPDDGPWVYWLLWHQPIRTMQDLGRAADHFCDVMLSVAGQR